MMADPEQRVNDLNDSIMSLLSFNKKDYIDVNQIYSATALDNKYPTILMILLLAGGYYLNDVVFTRNVAGVTSDVKNFIQDIDIYKLLYLLGPYIIGLLMIYGSDILFSYIIPKIKADSTCRLVDKIIESLRTSKQKINVNDLILHVKEFAGNARFYKVIFANIFPTIIVILNVTITIGMSDLSSGAIIIIVLALMLILTFKLELDNVKSSSEADIADHVLFDGIHEVISNIDTVITSDTKEKEIRNIERLKEMNYDKNNTAKIGISNTTFLMKGITLAAVFGINYVSYGLYQGGKISEELFVGNVLLSVVFMNYYNNMLHEMKETMGDTGAFLELYDFFKAFVDIDVEKNKLYKGPDLEVLKGDIRFSDFSVSYESGDGNVKNVFSGFNHGFPGQSVTGIIGEIGSGKSTLLKALTGVINYKGKILVDNQVLRTRNYKSIVKNIAYIPQHPSLFNKSITYNLKYGTRKGKQEIITLLKHLDLYDFFQSFSKGLDTVVGKGGNNLSGGEKQFVAIVRSLLQDKKILLLDEPSSSLDKGNKERFMKLIDKLKIGRTVIITTHDPALFKIFDNIVDIEHLKDKSKPRPNGRSKA